tara:strand:+ start:948 stop:1535 length:588 start_codon:yes stop_codon:yes gene_type:complete
MGIIGKDFNYIKVPNFLDKGEITLLNKYCEIMHRTNVRQFGLDKSTPVGDDVGDTCCHGDPVFDSLLLTKQKLMEKTTGKELLPTYTYWRMYTKHAILRKHKDRPACEISVTVHIGSDNTPWPIFMDGNEINTKPGDAVIYLGPKLEHYRERFQGDWQAQVFLHYVDAKGPHKDQHMDGRAFWGTARSLNNPEAI